MKTFVRSFLTILVFFACLTAWGQEHVFYISRNYHRNLVYYDIQLKDGKLDLEEPLKVYWYNVEDKPVTTSPLTFIQRQLAYGYSVEKKGNEEVTIKLKAYKKRTLRICKQGGKWVAITTINGKECIVKEIFAHCPTKMSCDYLEVRGKAVKDGSDEKETVR